MKIVFMGTPDYAVPTLKKLVEDGKEKGAEVTLVVTQPDSARGRGKKTRPTPVKEQAEKYGITVLQPEKIRGDQEFKERLIEEAPDLAVVIAFGQILPPDILEIPKYGCVNLHASLLPKYRGAAPIQWAIVNGEEVTGVTLMQMGEGLDSGDMLAKVSLPIDDMDAGQLHDKLAEISGDLIVDNLSAIENGSLKPVKQDDNLASYAPMIFKKDGLLDFSMSAEEIERRIRGFSPWPGCFTYRNGEMVKLWRAEARPTSGQGRLGEVACVTDSEIAIQTGDGLLIVKELQLPGKKRMKTEDLLRGKTIEAGEFWGDINLVGIRADV